MNPKFQEAEKFLGHPFSFCRCRPNKHGNISLLTVDNVKIKSYRGAVDFMLEHDDYSQVNFTNLFSMRIGHGSYLK